MLTVLHASLISALLAAPAGSSPSAEPPKAPPADAAQAQSAEVKKAKELFQWGQKLYKQARYPEAIAKFEEAYQVRPHPAIHFNIGKCYEQLGETGKALRAYRDYLRLSPEAKDKETVSDAIANLERRLREKGKQQLMVFAEPPSARISVDGKELGTSPASVELVAGNHTLTVTAEGFDKVERSFVMQTTRATEMTITLRPVEKAPVVADAPKLDPSPPTVTLAPPPLPPPVAPSPEPKKGRLWTFVAGGAAVASLGTAIGLGVGAETAAQELRAREHPRVEAQRLYDSSSGMATGSNIAYGVAGVALATAIVLFFVEQ